MTAPTLSRDDNPRWLAALVAALPVALAALFVLGSSAPDTRRLPAAVSQSRPESVRATEPDPTVARAP